MGRTHVSRCSCTLLSIMLSVKFDAAQWGIDYVFYHPWDLSLSTWFRSHALHAFNLSPKKYMQLAVVLVRHDVFFN